MYPVNWACHGLSLLAEFDVRQRPKFRMLSTILSVHKMAIDSRHPLATGRINSTDVYRMA
jgi:hypothetical protein